MLQILDQAELRKFIHKVHSTEPLDISKPTDKELYVEHLQGPRDALLRLKSEIEHRDGDGVYLFTGQIGSGKSTELLRLKNTLQSDTCKVYYCDLEGWLNLNAPIDLASILLALVASWIDTVGTISGKRNPVERLMEFFKYTNITINHLNIDTNLGKKDIGEIKAQLQLALKTDESFRARLENTLKTNTGSFVNQVHRFISELVSDICKPYQKCVLIADSLEKIRGYGTDAEKVYESVQNIFLSEGRALCLPSVHVVYSVSPFLLARNPQLPSILGQGLVVTMPSVHIFKKCSTDLDIEGGVKQMTTLLEKRYKEWGKFIPTNLLNELIKYSGGDLRDYLRAIKVVLIELEINPDVPREELLDVVRGQISPPKLIPSEHIAWMAKLERSHDPELGDKVDSVVFQRYLATKHILAYLNGNEWFAIHPLLRNWVLERPEAKLPA